MAAKRLTAGSVDEFRRTEHGFSAIFRAILALVGRARLAEVPETRIQFGSRTASSWHVVRRPRRSLHTPRRFPFRISRFARIFASLPRPKARFDGVTLVFLK